MGRTDKTEIDPWTVAALVGLSVGGVLSLRYLVERRRESRSSGTHRRFGEIAEDIETLRDALNSAGIDIDENSPFATTFYLSRQLAGSPAEFQRTVASVSDEVKLYPEHVFDDRTAMSDINGVHQLALMLRDLSPEDLGPFEGHLTHFSTGSGSQGRKCATSDDGGRKLLELLVALAVSRLADDVELAPEDVHTQTNPDVLGTLDDTKWGFPCKVSQTPKPKSNADNVWKGLEQLEVSSADRGLVVLGLRNVLPHRNWFGESAQPFPDERVATDTVAKWVRDWWTRVRDDLARRKWKFSKSSRSVLAYVETNVVTLQRKRRSLLCRKEPVCTTLRFFQFLSWDDASEKQTAQALNNALHGRCLKH